MPELEEQDLALVIADAYGLSGRDVAHLEVGRLVAGLGREAEGHLVLSGLEAAGPLAADLDRDAAARYPGT